MARAASLVTADNLLSVTWPSGAASAPWITLEQGQRIKGVYFPSNMRGVTEVRFRSTHDYESASPTGYMLRFAEEGDNTPEPFEIGGSGYSGSYFPFIHYVWSGVRRFQAYRQSGTNPTADLEFVYVTGLLWHN